MCAQEVIACIAAEWLEYIALKLTMYYKHMYTVTFCQLHIYHKLFHEDHNNIYYALNAWMQLIAVKYSQLVHVQVSDSA